MTKLERLVMMHRYLYYVENQPIITDQEYDKLESKALEEVSKSLPLHQPGSDLESSYDDITKQEAINMRLTRNIGL